MDDLAIKKDDIFISKGSSLPENIFDISMFFTHIWYVNPIKSSSKATSGCYFWSQPDHQMGSRGFPRHDEAVGVLQKAKDLYDRSIGTESPLYGSACERQLVEVVLVEGFSWQLWMCFFFSCAEMT